MSDSGLSYWVRWQTPVCAVIIIAPSVLAVWAIKRQKTEVLYYDDLWKPRWRKLSPFWLFFYRVFAFIFLSSLLYEVVALDGIFAFYFYTQWTFTLVIVYFAVGSVISAYGCWVWSKKDAENVEKEDLLRGEVEQVLSNSYRSKEVKGNIKYAQDELRQRAGFWGYLMQITYQICGGAVILTDIVFWCVIVPFLSNSHLGLNLLMGCMHTLNVAFLLLDTALNNLQFPWFRIAYFVQWSCLYVVFQWIIHACGFTWWPYPFLELQTPSAPLWYFSIAVVHIPCYGLYALIVRAKNSILPRLFPDHFLRSY